MALQKFIAKRVSEDGMVRSVGNSRSWYYVCDENRILFFKEDGPGLEYRGNYIDKMLVFRTGNDFKFLGEAKMPSNPIRRAMWVMGWTRSHEVKNIDAEEQNLYVREVVRDFRSMSGALKARAGRRDNDTFFWWWQADWKRITMEDVKEFAVFFGKVDVLGIPRRDESTPELREFAKPCSMRCNECKFGKYYPQDDDWVHQVIADQWGCKKPQCNGTCNICIHQINKSGYSGSCALGYEALDRQGRATYKFFEDQREKEIWNKYAEMLEKEIPHVTRKDVLREMTK